MKLRRSVCVGMFLLLLGYGTAAPTPGPGTDKVHPSLQRLLAAGSPVNAWVFFTDKGPASAGGAAYRAAINELERTYNPRAVERRRMRRTDPGLFDIRDVPLVRAYIEQVAATGATIRVESPWVNGVSVKATPEQAAAIAALPCVRLMQPIRTGPGTAATVGPVVGGGTADGFYGNSEDELEQINLVSLHQLGFTGAGIIVGILDTGFYRNHEAFNHAQHPLQVVAEWDFVKNDPNAAPEPGDPPGQHDHGTMILGVLGAYRPGTLVGGAYDASFILCKTEDIESETPVEEDNYVAGLAFIEQHGGDMATSSLGYIDWYTQSQLNGLTAVTAIGVNTATANGVFCCTAAGNEGHDGNPATSHLIAPADALKVLTCGAVFGSGDIVGFSSDGPTADGRVKPEVLAKGAGTSTVSPGSTSGYTTASGTSLSTPLVASAAACLIQARPTWTVDGMRTMVFATAADQVANGHPDPLFVRGYGIIDAAGAAAADCNGNGIPDPQDISGGSSRDCNANATPDECECRPDFNGDGSLTVADFGAFQSAYVLAQPCADFNGDGQHSVADFGAFQTGYVLGCP
ncbi:MAG: S8 family serine peptidase [Phycisphaerales bacterium]